LCEQPYIVSATDHEHFRDLQDRIRKLGFDGALPDCLEMGTWQKTWNIWQEVQARPKPEFRVLPGPDRYTLLQETARQLRDQRSFVRNVLDREGYTEKDLDLDPGDLTTLEVDSDNIIKMADRVSAVYEKLRPLTSDQTRTYFAERRLLLVEQRLAALEAATGANNAKA
jgi:hypothetical protein